MHNQADSKERSKSGDHPHGQSRLWPQPTRTVTHGELAQAKPAPMRQWWKGWSTRPGAHHITAPLAQHRSGHTYLHKAAWGWHSALLLGQTLGSIMAFLFLAWMWSYQFDNVILLHPCGFCPTALNCSPPPQRPTDASNLLHPLTCLWAFLLQSLLSFSLHLFSAPHFISSVTTQGSRSHKQISLWQDLKPSHP